MISLTSISSFRVAVVEFALHEPSTEGKLIIYECSDGSDSGRLIEYLRGFDETSNTGRVFIFEWSPCPVPTNATRSTLTALQAELVSRLGVPDDFFTEHTRSGPLLTSRENNIRVSHLPSSRPAEERWQADFFELWDLGRESDWPYAVSQEQLFSGDDHFTLQCEATGRQLQLHQWRTQKKKWQWLIIAPRKCSHWSRNRERGGWDSIYLCDPAPSSAFVTQLKESVSLNPRQPFGGGYKEFLPRQLAKIGRLSDATIRALESQLSESEGVRKQLENIVSPQTSFFDDLRYYFSRYLSLLGQPSAPSCTVFPLKLIASHYCLLHAFVAYQTASMRSAGWTLKRETPEEVDAANQVETAWSRFRCSEYLEALEAILDALAIPYDHDYGRYPTHRYRPQQDSHAPLRRATTLGPSSVISASSVNTTTEVNTMDMSLVWRMPASDFLYLHTQFRLRRSDYDRITTSIAALAGIIAGRLGISEARTAKTLTYVAMCFAPLGWVAGVYGIQGNNGPDGPQFWMYWASALPAMIGVWLIFYIWHYRNRMKRRIRMIQDRDQAV